MKLEQVQVIFRHGARTPLSFWSKKHFQNFANLKPEIWDRDKFAKKLPWTEIDYILKSEGLPNEPLGTPVDRKFDGNETQLTGGCYFGELTSVGQQQLFDLGKRLRDRYILQGGLISPTYQKREVYIRSTYYERTIQSAVCLIAGLYGRDALTEPVTIMTKQPRREDLVANCDGCTNFMKWYRYMLSDDARTPDEIELQNKINMLMGITSNSIIAPTSRINDLIHARRAHGLVIPEYLADHAELISEHASSQLQEILGLGSVHRVKNSIGFFLNTLCLRISEAITASPHHKLLFYSAHDWTLLSLLIAFGVNVKHNPPFASNIILELYKEKESTFLRILFNGEPIVLDSKDVIPVDRFLEMVDKYRVDDWDEDCGNVLEMVM